VMRYGGITGVMQENAEVYPWFDGGFTWCQRGGYYGDDQIDCRDIIGEYIPQPLPLPFTLKVGGRYETTKADGSPGPVIFDLESRLPTDPPIVAARLHRMFRYIVLTGGEIVCADNSADCAWNGYRIVREYVEPKPPTPIERLEKWAVKLELGGAAYSSELTAIIADLKAEQKP